MEECWIFKYHQHMQAVMGKELNKQLIHTTQNWQTSPDYFTVANFNPLLLPLTKTGPYHVDCHMNSAADLCLSLIILQVLQRCCIS